MIREALKDSLDLYLVETSKELWKATTSVSNQGRQRGRAKGLMREKNLNRGQQLGFGQARMVWPGLTTHSADKDRQRQQISRMSPDDYKKYEEGVEFVRSKMSHKKGLRRRQTPLERGWTSASPQGKKYGPPSSDDPSGDY